MTRLICFGGDVFRSRNKYGGELLFFINGAEEKIFILLSPKHAKQVLYSANECDPNPFVCEKIMHRLMGSPHATVVFYQSPGSTVDHD